MHHYDIVSCLNTRGVSRTEDNTRKTEHDSRSSHKHAAGVLFRTPHTTYYEYTHQCQCGPSTTGGLSLSTPLIHCTFGGVVLCFVRYCSGYGPKAPAYGLDASFWCLSQHSPYVWFHTSFDQHRPPDSRAVSQQMRTHAQQSSDECGEPGSSKEARHPRGTRATNVWWAAHRRAEDPRVALADDGLVALVATH